MLSLSHFFVLFSIQVFESSAAESAATKAWLSRTWIDTWSHRCTCCALRTCACDVGKVSSLRAVWKNIRYTSTQLSLNFFTFLTCISHWSTLKTRLATNMTLLSTNWTGIRSLSQTVLTTNLYYYFNVPDLSHLMPDLGPNWHPSLEIN